ncbi:hypothetical protein [Methylobacterium goesingense]|uniref:Lipoprotein YajG n=1 Tax=Methylobacterium goesingense TaxID=243690 RepID=A0ABV2LBU3_9HYPH|nr:hypothetical protein [Methylobacterium goesingense]GJD73615.1 hypothetical protein CFIICLFH_1844 [Methylobacterium goesingense]
MSRQRNSMAEIQPLVAEAPEEKADEAAPASKDPNARKKVSLYIKQSHYRRIRSVAADRDLMMQDVLDEALTAYFTAKGYMPSV